MHELTQIITKNRGWDPVGEKCIDNEIITYLLKKIELLKQNTTSVQVSGDFMEIYSKKKVFEVFGFRTATLRDKFRESDLISGSYSETSVDRHARIAKEHFKENPEELED